MIHGKEIRPPPVITRTGQKPAPPTVPDRPKPAKPVTSKPPPPPLPTRKSTTESQNDARSRNGSQEETAPALPPRNRPDRPALPSRKLSDSNASTASVSTTSTGGTSRSSTSDSRGSCKGVNPLRAPAWGETTLPPLPPKRNSTENQKDQESNTTGRKIRSGLQPPPSYDTAVRSSAGSALATASASTPTPRLPPRRDTTDSNALKDRGPVPLPLPQRSASGDPPETPSQRKVPLPPTRPAVLNRFADGSLSSLNKLHEERKQPEDRGGGTRGTPSLANSVHGNDDDPARRPAPPPRPSAGPKRIQPPSLESLNRKHEERNGPVPSYGNGDTQSSLSNGLKSLSNRLQPHQEVDQSRPPPVPLASRPDLSKIQATKPRMPAPTSPPSVPASSGPAPCLICRDFSAPDAHAAKFPRQSYSSRDLGSLAMQLTSPFPSATDKARVLFTWLHHNIEYDVDRFFNNNVQHATPETTFERGLAVCEGYAGLFERLAGHAGLEARKISGHGKGYSHSAWQPGDPIPPYKSTHAWNVVRIDDGYWKLIDTCWGAGCVAGKDKPYIKRFEPYHFIASNDEFGRKHFPTDAAHFYRDDGRPSISWEEYVRDNPDKVDGKEKVTVYSPTPTKYEIGSQSIQPQTKEISVNQPGPIRFQFGLHCPHSILSQVPYLYVLATHPPGGGKDELVPFTYVRGTGPRGEGDMWYLDIQDPRSLGAPGQKLMVIALTSFGDRKGEAARGLTIPEFRAKYGRTGWASSGVAEWTLA